MKVLLSIAGSDSSGGAGIQADIKTAENFGVYSTTALTVITAQNTQNVYEIVELSPDFIYQQINAVLKDFDVDAIKIGMLYSTPIIEMIKEILSHLSIPIVLDPVFIAKSGDKLLKDDAVESIKTLFPYVTLITPNLHEAKQLFGEKLTIDAPCPVLVKNRKSDYQSIDTLFYANSATKDFTTDFIDTTNVHGTGCSFSTAIAANLALGEDVEVSIQKAKDFIFEAIKKAPNLGYGNGPILHKTNLAKEEDETQST